MQTGESILSARLNSSNLIMWALIQICRLHFWVPHPAGLHRSSLSWKRVQGEFICPHRLSQRCWTTGIPPGTLPIQTYSCSPTPVASFVLCQPLLCLQSVGRNKKGMDFLKTTTHFPIKCLSCRCWMPITKHADTCFIHMIFMFSRQESEKQPGSWHILSCSQYSW